MRNLLKRHNNSEEKGKDESLPKGSKGSNVDESDDEMKSKRDCETRE